MTDQARTTLMLGLLCVACAALLYLDWRRQGEIDNLHARVDGLLRLEGERFMDTLKGRAHAGEGVAGESPHAPAVRSTVERILHADDDRTLADIAMEGAR